MINRENVIGLDIVYISNLIKNNISTDRIYKSGQIGENFAKGKDCLL